MILLISCFKVLQQSHIKLVTLGSFLFSFCPYKRHTLRYASCFQCISLIVKMAKHCLFLITEVFHIQLFNDVFRFTSFIHFVPK